MSDSDKAQADAAELHYCSHTVFSIYRDIKDLSNAMDYPALFAMLQREHSIQELERAEALLSVCISQLRVKKVIENNSATIIRLHEGLRK